MIEITFDGLGDIETALRSFSEREISSATRRAAKRAATHGKKIGSKLVRSRYTIKSADIKASTRIATISDGAILKISSARKSVSHYKARRRKKGVFVSVAKGGGDIVPRSFAWNKTFFKREEGVGRLPIEKIYGPAVPQLFENPAIQNEILDAASDKFEERILHELAFSF